MQMNWDLTLIELLFRCMMFELSTSSLVLQAPLNVLPVRLANMKVQMQVASGCMLSSKRELCFPFYLGSQSNSLVSVKGTYSVSSASSM